VAASFKRESNKRQI